MNPFDENDSIRGESEPLRWVRYISPERRVLWKEFPDCDNCVAEVGSGEKYEPHSTVFASGSSGDGAYTSSDSVLDAKEWRNAIDAVLATRQPQSNVKSFVFDGRPRWFSLQAFPDYGANGKFRGVIQVVEALSDETPDSCPVVLPAVSRDVHSIFEFAIYGVVFYSPEEDIIRSVNRRFSQETGYAVRELSGVSGRLVFGDDGISFLRNIFRRMITTDDGVVLGQVLSIHDRRGHPERYFCSLLLTPGLSGEPDERLLCISLERAELDDLTGVVQHGPNSRFIYKALQDGLWEFDAGKRVFFYAKAYAHIFGDAGVPGNGGKSVRDWFRSIYPGESEMVLGSLRRLLKTGERYRLFYRVRAPGGEWHWMFTTIHAILNDSRGRLSRIIGFHTDISEAMRSERKVLDAEERLRIVFENSGIGIALADRKGVIYQINPTLCHMFGRNKNDVEGRKLAEFAHPDSKREVSQCLHRLVHSGRREVMQDVRLHRPDGREMWVNTTFSLSQKGTAGDRYIVVTGADVTTAHAKREKLQYEATHDVMTGSWSRWILFERLEQHIHLSQRHNQPMAFCICDLDRFKTVNDIYGHQMGDKVLIRFVELLRTSLRDTDVIGRYGGEEFGVVFPNTTIEGAVWSLERFLEALRCEMFGDVESMLTITATIGVTGVSPQCTSKDVIAWADAALYTGKNSGRDRIVIADPPDGGWL